VTPSERRSVLDQLAASEARLLELTAGLSPEQWNFRESPERWSVADNIEHVTALEGFILAAIFKTLQAAPEPEKQAKAIEKESLVLNLAGTRDKKLRAREAVLPTGKWQNPAELIQDFRNARAHTSAFAAETDADLRSHFFAHIAFGDIDCYQWLIVLAQHSFRHALQIEETLSRARIC